MATLQQLIEKAGQVAVLKAHPVGSYFITDDERNPSIILGGGVWQRLNGRFLWGKNEDPSSEQEVGMTGGEHMHTLTEAEMPQHYHDSLRYQSPTASKFGCNAGSLPDTTWQIPWAQGQAREYYVTGYTGGSQPHNNMPPYYITNIWKRTA